MNKSKHELTAQIDLARYLVATLPFDTEAACILLNELPTDLDVQTRGAVRHAQRSVSALGNAAGNSQVALARFALARVVVLLERELDSAGP